MPDSQPLRGRDIVCVGFADWDTELWTNQHHLMSRLARREPGAVRRVARPAPAAARRARPHADRAPAAPRPAPPRAVDGRPRALAARAPAARQPARARAQRAPAARAGAPRCARGSASSDPILWAYVPQAEAADRHAEPSLSSTTASMTSPRTSASTRPASAPPRTASRRAPTSCSRARRRSPSGCARLRPRHRRPQRRRHRAVRAGARAGAPRPRARRPAAPADRLHRRDRHRPSSTSRCCSSSRAAPEWSLCARRPGRAGRPPRRRLARCRRAEHAPARPPPLRALPEVLRGADAGLIPYARNELTESIFPMKVYEYLAAGLPVVATPLPALADVDRGRERRGRRRLSPPARAGARAGHPGAPRRALARAPPRTPGSGACRRSPPRCTRCERPAGQHATRRYSAAGRPCAPTASRAPSRRTGGLTLLYARFGAAEPDAAFRAIPRIELREAVPSRGPSRLAPTRARGSRGCPRHSPAASRRELSPAPRALAAEPVAARDRRRPDRGRRAAGLARRRPVIYNAHNLESGFRHELGGLYSRGARRCATSSALC